MHHKVTYCQSCSPFYTFIIDHFLAHDHSCLPPCVRLFLLVYMSLPPSSCPFSLTQLLLHSTFHDKSCHVRALLSLYIRQTVQILYSDCPLPASTFPFPIWYNPFSSTPTLFAKVSSWPGSCVSLCFRHSIFFDSYIFFSNQCSRKSVWNICLGVQQYPPFALQDRQPDWLQ